jgi:hypothetical protein
MWVTQTVPKLYFLSEQPMPPGGTGSSKYSQYLQGNATLTQPFAGVDITETCETSVRASRPNKVPTSFSEWFITDIGNMWGKIGSLKVRRCIGALEAHESRVHI